MTEYDYSPSAIERYLETQSRVSHWVSNQSSETSKYSSPFHPLPSEAADPSRYEFYTAEPMSAPVATATKPSRSKSQPQPSEPTSPTPRRSHTDHGEPGRRSHRRHRDHSSSYDAHERDGSPQRHHTRRDRHRYDPEFEVPIPPPTRRHHHSRSHTTQVYYQPPMAVPVILPAPIRSQTMPAPIVVVPGGRPHAHHQIDTSKPKFITLPSRHQKFEVLASPSSETTASNPPTKKTLPLFKRLLGTLTGAHHSQPRFSPRREHPPKRKDDVRSWTLVDPIDSSSATSQALPPRDLEKKRSSGSSGAATLVNEDADKEKEKETSGAAKGHHRIASKALVEEPEKETGKTEKTRRSGPNTQAFMESGGKPRRKRGHTIH